MKTLGKRERVLRAFRGEEVDKRPFTFWHPFGLTHMKGESLAAAALSFAASYQVDLVRLPTVRDLPLPEQTSLDRPHDLTQFDVMPSRAGFWSERLAGLKTAARLAEKKVALFEVISDPLSALAHVCPHELLASTETGNPNFLKKAVETVAESLKGYAAQALAPGYADGLVVEIGSTSYDHREPEQWEALAKPALKDLINHLRGVSEAPIWLHVVGRHVYLDPLLDLPHEMLSWPHLSQGPALERLPRGYKGRIAGGLNEEALITMSFQEIRRHVEQARDQRVVLFSPGDALPADLGCSRYAALSNFLTKRDRIPEAVGGPSPRGRREPVIDEP